MATPWKQVIQSDAYKALAPDQQEQARQQYFAQVVAPQLPDDNARAQAKLQFDKQYGPSAIRPDDVVVRPTADQTQTPGVLDQLGRSAVLTGKSLAQGAIGLGDLISTPIRAGYNAIARGVGRPDAQLTTGGQAIDTLAQQAAPNFDFEPQNAGERYGNAISRGVGGALTGIGLGNVLAGSAAPVAAGVGQTLAANPGAQLAAATTGSGASQLTADMGGSPTQQLLAGIAGGLVPSAAGGALTLANNTLVQPFTQAGRRAITANYLSGVANAPINISPSSVPGVTPTLAEASGNPGLAQLQRALSNQPENVADFANLASTNNAARQNYLTGQLGTADDVANAIASRSNQTRPLYNLAANVDAEKRAMIAGQADQARQQGLLLPGGNASANASANAIASQIPDQVKPLLARPAFQQAVNDAKQLLAERGQPDANPLTSVQGLQAIKTSLDNAINKAPTNSAATFDLNAVRNTRSELVKAIQDISPLQREADTTFANLSEPIDAMNVGQAIQAKGSGNLTDVNTGVPSLQPNAFAGAVNSGDRIAQQITGQKNATLAGTLSPEQLQALQNVRGDLDRVAFANNAGRAAGSNTGQNILSQNALDNFSSAIGMPGLANTTAGKAIFTSIDKLYSVFGVPAALKADLTRVALNPQSAEAAQVWAQIPSNQRELLYRNLQPYLTALNQAQAGQAQPQAASR